MSNGHTTQYTTRSPEFGDAQMRQGIHNSEPQFGVSREMRYCFDLGLENEMYVKKLWKAQGITQIEAIAFVKIIEKSLSISCG